MREKINRGEIVSEDEHLSQLSDEVQGGEWGSYDVEAVEPPQHETK